MKNLLRFFTDVQDDWLHLANKKDRDYSWSFFGVSGVI